MKYLSAALESNVLNVGFLIPTVLDGLTVKIVFEELEHTLEEFRPGCVLLNFEHVSLLTSEMLGKLIGFRQTCADQGTALKLCNLSEPLIHLLQITKLNSMFSCHSSVVTAVEEFEDEQLVT